MKRYKFLSIFALAFASFGITKAAVPSVGGANVYPPDGGTNVYPPDGGTNVYPPDGGTNIA